MANKKDIKLTSLLLIGSTTRMAGKTTLVCKIIKKFSNKNIIAVKITPIRKSDKKYHNEVLNNPTGFVIEEEKTKNAGKDTSLFLAAGAKKSFWIRAQSNHIENAISKLLKKIPKGALLICESNSLRQIIEPSLFILVKGKGKIKPSSSKVIKYADIRVYSSEFDNLLQNLRIIRGKWMIKQE